MKDIHIGKVLAGDAPITYYDSAPGDVTAEIIVLINGTSEPAEKEFWALLPMLAMRHRVVTLDFLDDGSDVLDSDSYLDQVFAVVQAVANGRRVHLVGYSFGAIIAALFGARRGQSLASLTLVAGWIKTDVQQKLQSSIWRNLHADGHSALGAVSVLMDFSQTFLNSKNEIELEKLIQSAQLASGRSRKMACSQSVDIGDDLPNIDLPSLVIGCTQDRIAPVRHSRMLFSTIKDCRYAEIFSGHGIVHERPAELFTMIDMFVQNPSGMPAGHIIKNSHA